MSEQIHKRRKRYKGTHPRNFEEKYKELDPEMYPETIEKVISKGSTPAGMHISIMVDEILEFLDIQPGQVGLDCTLGYGGHTSKMLEKLDGQGHVYGLDIDSIEIEKTTQRLRNKGFDENLFTSILTNFRNIDEVSEKYGQFDFVLADLGVSSMQIDNPERGFSYKKDGPLDLRLNPKAGRPASQILKELSREDLENIFTSVLTNFRNIDEVSEKYGKFDFVLADLGVSSMQIDNPERGFSYKKEGPLDLRLNPKAGRPASEILKELSKEELENILVENSDEPYADILARNIYSFIRSGMEVETTGQLYKIIDKTLNFIEDKNRKDIVNKTAARVFQALRIEVNQEFEVLYEFVEKLPHILKPGGRVAILTFHSGEDRIVKKAFKEMKNSGVYEDVCRNVIRPTKEECHRNSRAKSTKMRWAIKAK